MIRFFADPQSIGEHTIQLSAEDSAHTRSLRLHPDELFVVCDSNRTDYICRLAEQQSGNSINDRQSIAQIVNRQASSTEPSVDCTVYIAYTKGERLDYAVQKSVELGAHEIVLYKSERCIVRPTDIAKKMARYQKIALEAAKQSGRGVVPGVTDIGEFCDALDAAVGTDLALLCYEDERNLSLAAVLERHFPFAAPLEVLEESVNKIRSIAVITGPEGGFESSEVKLAHSRDIPVVSLGPRILRSETAPAAALAAIMYHTGNL